MAETTYYVYDGAGQRVRKVTERQNGTRKNERIYLGGSEVYREYDGSGNSMTLERESLHVMDDKQRIALVETRTQGNDGSVAQLARYQFGNHLGSASLELDDAGKIISYEEYFPYGCTSYQAVDQDLKAASKRYRFTGMERDEESGLTRHGERNYAPWLGRWTSCDPIGLADGLNPYLYVGCNPIGFVDPTGTDGVSKEQLEYAQAKRDLRRADARLAAFLKTKEGAAAVAAVAAEARLEAAKASVAQLQAQYAAKKKELEGARADYAAKSVKAVTATLAAKIAAARAAESAEKARFATRLVGGLKAVQAGGEYVVAAGLAVVGAEPLAIAVALHASDVAVTAGRQMWTGENKRTLTSRGISAGAGLVVSDKTAYWIGEGGDAVVAMGISVKAISLGGPNPVSLPKQLSAPTNYPPGSAYPGYGAGTFGPTDLVLGTYPGGNLRATVNVAGGQTVTDIPLATGEVYSGVDKLSVAIIGRTVEQGGNVRVLLERLEDIPQVVAGTAHVGKVTSAELIYIAKNWEQLKSAVTFWLGGKQVQRPW